MTPRILIVDDDDAFRRLVARSLRDDYVVEQAAGGEQALGMLAGFMPDIVLLDISMPGIDGYETCRRIKESPAGSQTQVLMVSGHSLRQEQLRAHELGADDYLVKPIDVQELRSRVQLHLRMRDALRNVLSIKQEIASRNQEIKRLAEQRAQDLLLLQDVVVFTLAKVAESRDQDTGGHVLRVRAYCRILAEELGRKGLYSRHIDGRFLEDLHRASPLHDIGKVGIPDEILLKPGRLTPAEFARMQQHVEIGANILEQAMAQSPYAGFLAMAAVVARFHHERFDGSGYATGLAGHNIPLPARIVAVADVYDAITSNRSYNHAKSAGEAREIIQSERGRHFDPVIVDAFQARFDDFLQVGHARTTDSPLEVDAGLSRQDNPFAPVPCPASDSLMPMASQDPNLGDPMSQAANVPDIYSTLAVDPDFGELVEMFVAEMPDRIDALATQARNRDWQQLARTAHQFKGAVGSYGFSAITPSAARLEHAARDGSQEELILASLHDLVEMCRRARPGKSPAENASCS